jgi:hypothetical protein
MTLIKKIAAITLITLAMSSTANAGNYSYFTSYAPVFQEAFDAS